MLKCFIKAAKHLCKLIETFYVKLNFQTFLHALQSDLYPALNNRRFVAISVIRASAEHLRQPDLKLN